MLLLWVESDARVDSFVGSATFEALRQISALAYREVVMTPSVIAKKYLLGYFSVDLISSLPLGIVQLCAPAQARLPKIALGHCLIAYAHCAVHASVRRCKKQR
eukprot:6183682-Pleurochrysis_carterae.AAC.1